MTDELRPEAYERWRQSRLGGITEALEQRAVGASLPDIRGMKVLDAGCGDGTYAIQAAGRGARVTALDLSFPMLAAARSRLRGMQASAGCCQGDIMALPFSDDTFDLAMAITVLCMVDSPEKAMRELVRVLRPGGLLIIGELGRWSSWAISRRIRAWLGSRGWQQAHFWSPAELERLAREIGLSSIATRGAIYYPPCSLAAIIAKPWDSALSRLGGIGAAFLVLQARKNPELSIGSRHPGPQD